MAWHHRAAAGIGALLFLVTSVALTVTVLWSMHEQSQRDKINAGLQEALKQQQAQKQTPQEGKLQGTQLSGFTPVAKVDSLQKIDTTPGTGETVKAGDTVTVHYTGAVAATGVIFQSSKDTGQPVPLELKSGSVIEGWVQGVPGMKVGGTRRLVIPAALAYGSQEKSGIPANSDLVFDIELIKIGK